MKRVIETCDRCKKEGPNRARWTVELAVRGFGVDPTAHQQDWCDDCIRECQLSGFKPGPKKPKPEPIPTLEEIIYHWISEEVRDQ